MIETFYNPIIEETDLDDAIQRLPLFISDQDIHKYLGADFRIVKYAELDEMNHIDEILPHHKSCVIILIESEYNKGHFVAIGRFQDTIIQFDSYGGTIDRELNYISKIMIRMLGAERNALSTLIKKSGYNTLVSKVKYQSTKKICGLESSICGRACIIFCSLFKMGYLLDDIHVLMNEKKDHYEMIYEVELPYDIIFCLLII